ncbi:MULTISPECIES: phenylalanine--tRNA ligase subunit beta [Moraxella]|uniref:Phenylalanine--tRNA ligase beta subunit n=2 Tax=Gammaproteobacteria TaxID=1236 RepID=A0A1B8Q293_MORLA|nr:MULTISPECIES: phenylalanine--tRNA ligase subunit beta [Moraxella]MBE9578880.1 phenylalanine--tRNA ligase subunit beta [Moraxella sp. K1664]MBE9588510.1 phenylalanine--tRNA ligase subunit beta [Moraxella sp. K1630]MBE9589861.1 phenylalanine--tRNA ligase subunit beta [Moraxella sp. K127]MBE9596705.1 phenylalanine--tRNA ligase subunit beta [Moraxella sp. K2450]MDH9218813.1 phenylalanine--tRNA ligase subunit beta [Moraxella lacunata]
MKISENWLRQWVNPTNSSAELGEQLTMLGLELDGMEPIAPMFGGVVVGQVITCDKHPDADKLSVTTVNVGTDTPLQIVCGASNVRAGLKVAVATVGAELPPPSTSQDDKPFKIKKGKLRGVESQGMLCGASELGLIDEIDGLLELDDDAPIGVNVRDYLGLDGQIFDVAITPNRGDCLSVLGLAREMSVANRLPLNRPQISQTAPTLDKTVNVKVADATACPRYLAQYIGSIDRTVKTPKWLKDNLMASGLRTHNFLVDVTNFILLELGQPLHAFDADKIVGAITVRLANQGETVELLNEQTITLTGDELVIADDVGVLALAGIMGGSRSAVSDSTTNIVLESAHFNQLNIAGRARRFGLHTDASARFERGVDFDLPKIALDRATTLIATIANGQVGQITMAESVADLPKREPVRVPFDKVEKLLGVALSADDITDLLNRLEIHTTFDGTAFVCQPPSHRFDISISEDIIEEIARVYGYDNIAPRLPQFAVDMSYDDTADLTHTLKLTLAKQGYFEAVSFSFCDDKLEQLLHDDKLGEILPLANPISSELAVMRRTLLSSLLPIVSHNLNRQQADVRLFETGLSFVGKDVASLEQIPSLAIIATGRATDSIHGVRTVDFFDLKADVESLLPRHATPHYERADLAFLHSGQSAYVSVGGERIGYFGQLHPSISTALDLPTVWVAQFELDKLINLHCTALDVALPSKFPSVRRDLAFFVDKDLAWQDVADVVRDVAGEHLTDVALFDVYQGDKLPEGKKSLAFAMTLQDTTRTLSDDEIKALMDRVIVALTDKYQAQLRDS